jgi:hypothetical protein
LLAIENGRQVRGGVVRTNGSANNVTAIEVDMRTVLRGKRPTLTAVSTEAVPDYSSFVSGISVLSIKEIDHLIDGLQGLREKLTSEGDQQIGRASCRERVSLHV